MSDFYLLPGLAQPAANDLDGPFWEGLQQELLRIQRCQDCGEYQWGPEWICHHCHSENLAFEEVAAQGEIYSYERVWHPVHPALKEQGPYIVVLVNLPHASNVRVVGNLLGDPEQTVNIGSVVRGVFEHHGEAEPLFSLLHWQVD